MEQILFILYTFLESIEPSLLSANLIIESLKPLFFTEEYAIFHLIVLFIISLLICEENNDDIFEVFTLKQCDIEPLTSEVIGTLSFTMIQKLNFISKMCINTKNKELLTDENLVQMICSVYGDEKLTAEHELASAILACLYMDALQDITLKQEDNVDPGSTEDILSILLNDIAVHVEESLQGFSDEERGLRICVSLQHLLTNQLSDEGLESISSYPCAVNVFCIYLKLHIRHLGKL